MCKLQKVHFRQLMIDKFIKFGIKVQAIEKYTDIGARVPFGSPTIVIEDCYLLLPTALT